MKLRDWLKKEKKTQTWLAKKLDSDQSHVSDWINGKVMPSVVSIRKLEVITKNEVAYSDWAAVQLRGLK